MSTNMTKDGSKSEHKLILMFLVKSYRPDEKNRLKIFQIISYFLKLIRITKQLIFQGHDP